MSGFLGWAEGFANALLPALWRASWQGAIAIVAVWLVARFFSLSPRVICWAWRLVCLKMLVALVWMQPIELPVLPPVIIAVESMANVSAPRMKSHLPDVSEPAQPLIALPAKVPPAVAVEQSIGWKTWLGFAWIAGVAFCITLTLRQWLHVCRLRAACSAPASGNLAKWVAEEAGRLRIRRHPKVLIANTEGPLLIGILRPAIVLPARAEELFSEPELRLILRHELAHLKRHDLLWNWLPTVVGWLFFFHPLVWLFKRGWFESQEAACDELLIQNQAARPAEYGRLLVKLATLWPSGMPTSVAAAGVLGAYQNLERRILAMSRVKTISKQRLFLIAGLGALLAIAVIFPWRLVAQQSVAENAAPDAAKQEDLLRQSATNLNRIMLAIHEYVDSAGHYPAAFSGWGQDRTTFKWFRDRPYLSWRVALLPFLGEQELFRKFKFSEPWDSEHNRALISQMPAIYRAPGSKAGEGKTNYLGVFGPHAAFSDKGTLTVPDFTDGTSKTAMIVEVSDAAAVEWTRPVDFPADTKDSLTKLLGMREGGFLSVFADAAPHFISKDVSPELLKTMLSRNDGVPGNYEDWKRWDRFVEPLPSAQPQGKGDDKKADTKSEDASAQSPYQTKDYPITVMGRALDSTGKPIAGAKIYLVGAEISPNQLLAEATTDAEGRYEFRDVKLGIAFDPKDPMFRPQGAFEVFGTAAGHAFAWSASKSIMMGQPPPGVFHLGAQNYYVGSPISIDLAFAAPKPVGGRFVDKNGQPIAGVKVEVVGCAMLDGITTAGAHLSTMFNSLHLARELLPNMLNATSNAEGKFEFSMVPANAMCRLEMKDAGYGRQSLYITSADSPPEKYDGSHPVIKSSSEIVLDKAQAIPVQVKFLDTNAPAAGVKVNAYQKRATGNYSYAESDQDGKLMLILPPGKYRLCADPPPALNYIRTYQDLTVEENAKPEPVTLLQKPGCELTLKAIDVDSGKGVPGVSFWYEPDDDKSARWEVQYSGSSISRPKTDERGEIHAIVDPGSHRYGIYENSFRKLPTGYWPVTQREVTEGRVLDLPAGKSVSAEFKLQRKLAERRVGIESLTNSTSAHRPRAPLP